MIIITLTIAALTLLLGLKIGSKSNNEQKIIEQASADTTTVAKRVLNLIILDESGSMSGLEKTSVDGVNETIQTIKSSYEQLPEQEQLLTFVTFSSIGDSFCRTKVKLTPISQVNDFKVSEYKPNGGTPLYDTMGLTLTELEKEATESDLVLVTIITDGYENTSRKYNAEGVKALVERLDKKDWVFTYIGANQDAILEAGRMGIRNAMNYSSDEAGTREMWDKEKRSRELFLRNARTGYSAKRLKDGYFKEEER